MTNTEKETEPIENDEAYAALDAVVKFMEHDTNGFHTSPAVLRAARAERDRFKPPARRVKVVLFKSSGKYYTEEEWRIPGRAIGPYDMARSPDFHRIGSGAVLVETQEPWGFPHLFPGT